MDAHDRMFGEIAVRLELLTREQLAACRKAQAESAGKRSLPQLAQSLGLMSESEIQLVSEQQRKVLERRREAREAGSVTHPERPAPRQASARARGVNSIPPSAPRADAAVARAPGRESQPAPRPESRTRTATSQPPPIPREALASTPPRVPHESKIEISTRRGDDTRDDMEREPTVPRVSNEPPPLQGAPDKDERPGKRTEVPPARARRLASPPPANSNHEPRGLSRGMGGTLLATSGRAAQLDVLRGLAPPEGSLRPAADRGWRNPSRPPPPHAVARPELLEPAGLGLSPRATLAWPAPAAALEAGPVPATLQPAPAELQSASTQTIPADGRYLDQLLGLAIDTGASDLHAHSGSPVLARVDGVLWPLTADAPLTPPAAEQVIAEILTDEQWDELQLTGEMRFAYELPGIGRFRAHAYRQAHGLDVVFRVLPTSIPDPKDLSLPTRMLLHVLEARSGLFLISGPPGAGKTTTLASLGHVLANEHNLYVATAEAPIEIVHGPGLGMIEQREVPADAHTFAECIEQVRRQGAEVIVVSELSSASAIEAALDAALAGCAVLASVQAESPWSALAQLLSHFDGSHRTHARTRLALATRAVFTQHLLPRSAARGRIPAVEMLLGTPQIAQLIMDDQLEGLEALMGAQNAAGMQTLENALHELARARAIAPEVAQRAARRERTETSST